MTSKPKRPSVVPDLEALTVRPAVPAPAPAPKPQPDPEAQPDPAAGAPFRTSVWMGRGTHEKLREIAFHERKSFADLFREGLDHVLSKRGYATTAELETNAKRK